MCETMKEKFERLREKMDRLTNSHSLNTSKDHKHNIFVYLAIYLIMKIIKYLTFLKRFLD